MRIPVIVLFAPTASGKTALAINLFGKSSHSFFKGRCQLISADSMQVYKGLDIGTAKPTVEEKSELTHHLVDLYEPDSQFSVADFVKLCDEKCRELYSKGIVPFVAGGTGFYIRNFILGLPETPESDPEIREKLKKRIETEGNDSLYKELCSIDPESAEKINVNDAYRICRALEIFYTTGKKKSSFEIALEPRKEYDFCVIILKREREELYERINSRVDLMFQQGLETEVRNLMDSGCSKEMPGMQAIGYREWFCNDCNTPEGIERIKYEIKRNSRKYAKKQYTFMSDIPGAKIVEIKDEESTLMEVESIIKAFLAEKKI